MLSRLGLNRGPNFISIAQAHEALNELVFTSDCVSWRLCDICGAHFTIVLAQISMTPLTTTVKLEKAAITHHSKSDSKPCVDFPFSPVTEGQIYLAPTNNGVQLALHLPIALQSLEVPLHRVSYCVI